MFVFFFYYSGPLSVCYRWLHQKKKLALVVVKSIKFVYVVELFFCFFFFPRKWIDIGSIYQIELFVVSINEKNSIYKKKPYIWNWIEIELSWSNCKTKLKLRTFHLSAILIINVIFFGSCLRLFFSFLFFLRSFFLFLIMIDIFSEWNGKIPLGWCFFFCYFLFHLFHFVFVFASLICYLIPSNDVE